MAMSLLEMRNIVKRFPGVAALSGVDLVLNRGEVHSLMGENGAGKSTLIKVLTGVYERDGGSISLDGRSISPRSPLQAQRHGIATVYQEVNLLPNLSVAENILLGREPRTLGKVNWGAMRRHSLERLNIDVDVTRDLSTFSIAIQQMVAIARVLDISSKILVLDEPTSSLDQDEVAKLFEVIRQLRSEGMGIVFITHFIDQVYAISDRITVLRNGSLIGSFDADKLSRVELVARMLGKELTEFQRKGRQQGDEASEGGRPTFLKVSGLGRGGTLEPVDLEIRRGEIVALTRLLGAGRTELAQLIFGVVRPTSGVVEIDERRVTVSSPKRAMMLGMALCPEDRKGQALIEDLSVRENIALVLKARRGIFGSLSRRQQDALAEEYIRALNIKTPSPDQPVRYLSGGNQQKVVIASWLALGPRLLILDEPTRGIDVGAKAELLKLVLDLAGGGMGILFISAEMEEVVNVCDRVMVLRDHKKIGELASGDASITKIMQTIAQES